MATQLYDIGLSLLEGHETDAVRRHEWRLSASAACELAGARSSGPIYPAAACGPGYLRADPGRECAAGA